MTNVYQLLRMVGARPLLLAAGLGAPLASHAQYTPGNLVVVQVGDGTPFTTVTTATRLVEYSPAGVFQSSITMNATDPGNKLTNTDNSPTEGMLTLSADGRYLLTTGYNAPAGVIAASVSAATVARTVARINSTQSVDISTVLPDAFSGNSNTGGIRSAASLDGSAFWLAGASSGTGLRYAVAGTTTSNSLLSTPSSVRVVRAIRNAIYFSTGSGTPGIYLLGPASNVSQGQTATLLIGTGSGSSPYSFVLLDRNAAIAGPDVAYIADENNGLGKWAFDGTNWTRVGVLATNVRGLTGTTNADGSVTLYATTRSSAGSNELVTTTDTNFGNASFSSTALTSLYKAPTNVALRGVEFAPGTAVVLPVVLASFGASRTPAGVQLRWATASEHNSARFEVQRSLDGRTFATVARVAAAGTSQLAHTYGTLDGTAPLAALYYRLRQVDQDGTCAYSPVATVRAGGPPTDVLLTPNPAHDYLYLTFALPTSYTVRSVLGQTILSGNAASGTAALPVASLPTGVYLLELRTAEGRSVRRFVKE
jgi:hypothetical protein